MVKNRIDRKLRLTKRGFWFGMIEIATFVIFSFFVYNWVHPLHIDIAYSTLITDSKGKVLNASLSEDDKWRMRIESEEVSELLKKTFIVKEDKHFYYHPGVNPLAIARALYYNVVKGKRTSGASTITMQVIRLSHPRKRTYYNKLIEVLEAFQLELNYTKDDILNMYLNLVPYGGNIEGVKSVALLYLNKLPLQLSLSECVALSVIPNRPNSLRPGKYNERINQVKNDRLLIYKSNNTFAENKIEDAISEDFIAKRYPAPREIPHLARKLKTQYPSKYNIVTTIDYNIQKKVELLTRNYSKKLSYLGIFNAAVLIIDNRTRQVLSYVGSSNFADDKHAGQVDGVVAIRSPGSTLKPFLYGLSMDEGHITPMTKLLDVPLNIEGYEPENYDGEFHGSVTASHALAHSLNIPAVRLLEQYTAKSFVEALTKAGFDQIERDRDRLGLSMILGGCGVSLENLCSLYASLANDGVQTPLAYTEFDINQHSDTLLTTGAAYLISKILLDVSRPDLPNSWRNTVNLPAVAWKTGTSYGRKDAWSIGYNDELTIGVWVGNFDNRGVPEMSGTTSAAPLLFQLFNTVASTKSKQWLARSPELDYREICSVTGMVPNEYCENLIIDDYIPGWSTTQRCNHKKKIWVNPDSTIAYCLTCRPEAGYKEAIYDFYPPELVTWFEQKQVNYNRIPPHNKDCERIFYDDEPKIVSPVNGLTYYMDVLDSTELVLACQVKNDVDKVYWFVNDKILQEAKANEEVFFFPTKGRTRVTCVDDKGRKSSIDFLVKYANF